MRFCICVDDTDDMTKTTSTGKIADMIADAVTVNGSIEKGLTRHQLLLHDDIAYTSHNSSICFITDTEMPYEDILATAEKIICENSVPAADPGLCICKLDELDSPDKLIAYGKRAQKEVIKKAEAYALAAEFDCIFLNEYGGTGAGVIGALAGVGLRLSGCDGTFRGKMDKLSGVSAPAGELKKLMGAEQVIDMQANEIPDDTIVHIKNKAKLFFYDNKKTLSVILEDGVYYACKKNDVVHGDKSLINWRTPCDKFETDNDFDECMDSVELSCYNCLYRRWTPSGFKCVL